MVEGRREVGRPVGAVLVYQIRLLHRNPKVPAIGMTLYGKLQ
jgi:hypothetical protein